MAGWLTMYEAVEYSGLSSKIIGGLISRAEIRSKNCRLTDQYAFSETQVNTRDLDRYLALREFAAWGRTQKHAQRTWLDASEYEFMEEEVWKGFHF